MQNFENTAVYWCDICHLPIIVGEKQESICPNCKRKLRFLAKDLKPVFPQEIALLELITDNVGKLQNRSVWKGRSRYYIDGEPLFVSNKQLSSLDVKDLRKALKKFKYDYSNFNNLIEKFAKVNRDHLKLITEEAKDYILSQAKAYNFGSIMIPFSGGKDSTVTADIVSKTLQEQEVKFMFADTTLEHDLTYEYINRVKNIYNIEIAKNNEKDFYKMAKLIGPPSRMSRWCCYVFKTGPVHRLMQEVFKNGKVLTFYGIRKNESNARSKYNRTEDKSEHKKIENQIVCSPIFYWKEIDVWLYILSNKLDFNEAYRLGYSRVGCWCCPNASEMSELLAKIYMKEKYEKWHKFLITFARGIGVDNAEDYVRLGAWKARQGGQGLKEARTVKLLNQACTSQENTKIYELYKPISNELYNLFIPFGKIIDGDTKIGEKLVLERLNNNPIISIQKINDYKVKITTLNVKSHFTLHRNISHQIIKFNACKQCLKCEGVCPFGAISVSKNGCVIDKKLCKHCQRCVSSKYIPGGCMMCRYLRTRR